MPWALKTTVARSGTSSSSSTKIAPCFRARADDLVVILVADQDDRVALARVANRLEVHLGHERARRVDHPQAAALGLPAHLRRDAVGAEDHGRAVGHLVELVDEDRALLPSSCR